jgi:integrase
VLGGLRRCEVIGLRLGDLQVAQRRVFIAEGKGGLRTMNTWSVAASGGRSGDFE